MTRLFNEVRLLVAEVMLRQVMWVMPPSKELDNYSLFLMRYINKFHQTGEIRHEV